MHIVCAAGGTEQKDSEDQKYKNIFFHNKPFGDNRHMACNEKILAWNRLNLMFMKEKYHRFVKKFFAETFCVVDLKK